MDTTTDKREESIKQVIDNDLHPECFHLLLLGENFHADAVKGTLTFRSPYLRMDNQDSDKHRNNITKNIFNSLSDYTTKERMKTKAHNINFFLSWQGGNGSTHLHFLIYKEGFERWDPEKIISWLKKKTNRYSNSSSRDFGIHKTIIGKSFSRYINRQEKSFNSFNQLYEGLDGKKFFSCGLMKTIKTYF